MSTVTVASTLLREGVRERTRVENAVQTPNRSPQRSSCGGDAHRRAVVEGVRAKRSVTRPISIKRPFRVSQASPIVADTREMLGESGWLPARLKGSGRKLQIGDVVV